MAIRAIDENPKITDTVRFLLETPDADDCLISDPYKIDNIKIYYVERDFLGSNYGEYEKSKVDESLLDQIKVAREAVCLNPTEENIFEVTRLQNELDSKTKRDTFYYKDAVLIHEVGTPTEPVWLSTDVENAFVTQVTEDSEGNDIYGTFIYDWTPKSRVREGDFFICWTWTPLIAGTSLSAHTQFSLWGDGQAVQTLPTHITPEDKYKTLLERYLPEMYKAKLTDDDITPEVTYKLNQAIGDGFTYLENFANQIIDLYDGNVLHESLLVYLSNLFNLKLKSDDPTLWRRQIKESVPLFKKKGTLSGLEEAFAQAGMTLDKYTTLWQVVSPYTWQQSFLVADSPTFKLDKPPIEIDENNFGVWIRREGESSYTQVANDTIEFSEVDCEHYVTWIGDEKSVNSVDLYEGDILKILYQYAEIPSGQQDVEDYIRSLSLADSRDEGSVTYPPKNWNVRVIEEDDPMFDVIIPVRHPFHDDIIFGQIRTEFPYSENIYNMEEYNGSTRDSTDVCFIDKAFRDPCGSCISSKYNIDVSIEGLSNDRLVEVYDILSEYTPFTSVLHQVNFKGEVVDFVNSPVEEINFLVQINLIEMVLSGQANPFFHRVMEDGLTNWVVDREDLSEQVTKVSGQVGTAYNRDIALISPNVNLEDLGLIIGNHIMKILSPSPNAGNYSLDSVKGETGIVATSVIEPLNTDAFTFELSNVIYESNSTTSIFQENCGVLTDSENTLSEIPIKTNWDINNTPDYSGGAWQVYFPSLSLTVDIDRTEGDSIFLDCNSTITAGSYTFKLLDDDSNEVFTSTGGNVTVNDYGRIVVNDPGGLDITDIVRHGDYLLYDGTEYKVDELRIDGNLIVNDYTDGDAVGVPVRFLRRLVSNEVGYFVYSGLRLITGVNHESAFGIQNGSGSPVTDPDLILDNSNFKENYLIQIDTNYYKIAEITGTDIILEGLPQDWGTFIAGGTLVQYSVLQFVNDTVETQFVVFDQLDRRGKDPVIREIESTITSDVAIVALSLPQGGGQGLEEVASQDESVTFEIEYMNGETEEGEL